MSSSSFKNIIYYKEIDSTQKEIWRRIENGTIGDGTVIIADIQTDGIGTHGRKWYTSQQGNIAFSFAICPNISEIFKEIYNIELSIKNPNDIVIDNKKIGGILTQTKLQAEIVKYLVIGIGINTNQLEFDKEIKDIASSIKKEFNISIDNNIVIQEFGHKFEENVKKRWEKS